MNLSEINSYNIVVFKRHSIIRSMGKIVAMWSFRYQQRRALKTMSDHVLRDIGLSREQARTEARKPFWVD